MLANREAKSEAGFEQERTARNSVGCQGRVAETS